MTASRGLLAALTAGSLALGLAGNASAQIINTISGTNSQIDAGCLGLLLVVGTVRCQYDNQPFPGSPFLGDSSSGPIAVAGHYAVGNSPWDNAGGPGDISGTVGDGKFEFPLIGSVTIDDKGSPCTADDTIAANIGYGAGTRNFAGGPGTQGEETWGDGDLSFVLDETVVDFATPNGGGGCDYVIGDAGAPTLLTTAGGAEYGDDVDIGRDDPGQVVWQPNDGTDYTGEIPSITTLEVNANTGAPLTVVNGPSYVCTFFDGGAGACQADGSHHDTVSVGDRAAIENSIWVISTDGGGNITSGTAYPVSENSMGGFGQPQWLAPRWSFTGTNAGAGGVANDDSASTLQDTGVDIDVLANDSGFTDPVTVTIDTDGGSGTATVNGSPGNQADVDITYLPNAGFTGQDTFVYQVDDGVFVDTATVTVTVEEDTDPVAPDGALTLDTQGRQGTAAAESLDVAMLPGYAPGNGTPVCTISTAATNGTATCMGTTVTYTPDDSFVNGGDTDSFEYQLEDDQGDTATGTIDVDITNVEPAIAYAPITTDEGTAGNSAATVTPGNGTPAQHSIAVSTDATSGSCSVNGDFSVTYTPDEGFSGADTCTVTLTDADGDDADGVVTITVNEATNEIDIRLPGGKSSMDLVSLLLLGGLPFLRRRRRH